MSSPSFTRRRCERPGCTREVRLGTLACGPHWHALSYPTRVRIGALWAALRRGEPSALEEWRAAVTVALREWDE